MKVNKKTYFTIYFILAFGIFLLDVIFKIFNDVARRYLSYSATFIFVILVILLNKRK